MILLTIKNRYFSFNNKIIGSKFQTKYCEINFYEKLIKWKTSICHNNAIWFEEFQEIQQDLRNILKVIFKMALPKFQFKLYKEY